MKIVFQFFMALSLLFSEPCLAQRSQNEALAHPTSATVLKDLHDQKVSTDFDDAIQKAMHDRLEADARNYPATLGMIHENRPVTFIELYFIVPYGTWIFVPHYREVEINVGDPSLSRGYIVLDGTFRTNGSDMTGLQYYPAYQDPFPGFKERYEAALREVAAPELAAKPGAAPKMVQQPDQKPGAEKKPDTEKKPDAQSDKSAQKVDDHPTTKTVDSPAEKTADKSTRKSVDKSVDKSIDNPTDKSSDAAEQERIRKTKEQIKKLKKTQVEQKKTINSNLLFPVPEEKKIAFLIDNSGSVGNPEPTSKQRYVDLAVKHIPYILKMLRPDQLFTISIFGDRPYTWSRTMKPATPNNIESALNFMKKNITAGEIGEVLESSLDSIEKPDVALVISDGELSREPEAAWKNFEDAEQKRIDKFAQSESGYANKRDAKFQVIFGYTVIVRAAVNYTKEILNNGRYRGIKFYSRVIPGTKGNESIYDHANRAHQSLTDRLKNNLTPTQRTFISTLDTEYETAFSGLKTDWGNDFMIKLATQSGGQVIDNPLTAFISDRDIDAYQDMTKQISTLQKTIPASALRVP